MKESISLEQIRAFKIELEKQDEPKKEHHTIKEVLDVFHPIEFGIISILLCIPFIQPIPLSGLSTILGGVIALLSLMTCLSLSHALLPKKILQTEIKTPILYKFVMGAEKIILSLHKLPNVRLPSFLSFIFNIRITAFFIFILAGLLALPIPLPFTNTLPAFAIIFFALSLVEQNFIIMVAAYITFLANILVFGGLVYVIWLIFYNNDLRYIFSLQGLDEVKRGSIELFQNWLPFLSP